MVGDLCDAGWLMLSSCHWWFDIQAFLSGATDDQVNWVFIAHVFKSKMDTAYYTLK